MRKLFLAFCFLSFSISNAQAPEKWTSSEIFNHIKKLNFLGSVLYIAAHPDDENTRLISYFSNEINARTAYLSLTRGDGGQNLIGPELREQLGLIRTQELLAARKIDGGEQFFTRANDFGYSKTPTETLEIWNKSAVLSDVVWTIRKFRPDVIINRFDHRTPGSTHGHHTSSAMLSTEAFELAGDKNAFPEQLEYVTAYSPKRLFFNTSPWFYGSQEAFKEADKSNFLTFDTGVYFPLKGLSNPEIASLSRSQHRSQGFGSTGSRGKQLEYLELLKGDLPAQGDDVFDGINTTWTRIKNGDKIGSILEQVEKNYDFQNPSKSLPQLLEAYQLISELEDEHWKNLKTKQLKEIIYAVSGLYLEAAAEQAFVIPGKKVEVDIEAINRSDAQIVLKSVKFEPNNSAINADTTLFNNEKWNSKLDFHIPEYTNYTTPYWLEHPGSIGTYKVEDQLLRGLPETPLKTKAIFEILINDVMISFERPVIYKYNDEVTGETYQNFDIVPALEIKFDNEVLIFNTNEPQNISVKLTSNEAENNGQLHLSAGKGWKIEPIQNDFSLNQIGASTFLSFKITPSKEQDETKLTAEAFANGKTYSQEIINIDYEHFPNQNLITNSVLKLVKLDITKKGNNIAYIEGAGDIVPESLEQIGYEVTLLPPSAISESFLNKFDAVILGIRAYNTVEELKFRHETLMKYVKNGGTMIVQYNTNRGLLINDLAPYKLNISRDRVTEENAKVSFLKPEHSVLNYPNKITEKDFDGWVQERGLYFPDSWDENFTAVLSMHDTNEAPKDGSLLVTKYGEGYYIYTGISFFRQFPEAVPGAFRLFANLISLGK